MNRKRQTNNKLSPAEWIAIAVTVVLTCGLLFVGLKSTEASEAKPEPTAKPAEIPAVPVAVVTPEETPPCDPDNPECEAIEDPNKPKTKTPRPEGLCGSEELQQNMASLRQSCSGQRVCLLGGSYKSEYAVDVSKVYEASSALPFTMGWFGSGRAKVSGKARKRIRKWLTTVLADDERNVTLFVFGSSSPTGRAAVNIRLGQDRTEAFARAVLDEAERLGKDHLIDVPKTNLGYDSLDDDFCTLLPSGSDERTLCSRLNKNRARQAAYVLAYPDLCLDDDSGKESKSDSNTTDSDNE